MIRGSSFWRSALAAVNLSKRARLEAEVVKQLCDHDIDELVDIYSSGTPDEQYESVRLLAKLSRGRDPRVLRPDRLARWVGRASELVRANHPRSPIGMISFAVLREQDRPKSSAFLTSELETAGLHLDALVSVIFDLRMDGSPGAIAALERIAALGGEAGSRANAALEFMIPITSQRLRELANEWARTKASAPLNKLWALYVSRLKYGEPIGELIAMLGEPSRRDGAIRYYQANDSDACLILETNANGGVVTWKLGG